MTRRYLLDAAAVVFARDGFHGATLDEAAATAGFTKGAVYSNFKSKDDLFLELLHDRVERQWAITTEVLEAGSRDREALQPRMRDLLRAASFLWDDAWNALSLEFVLYALRNPQAREKLAASAATERDFVEALIEREYEAVGATPRYPTRHLAEISLAIFSGLALRRLVDPDSVDDELIDTVLAFLYDSMGVDDPTDAPEPG
jgi:AcrR family transcriptional regulator